MKRADKPSPTPPRRPIGLFGGTFDPPHLGHLFAALVAMHRLGLEKVIFIPSGRPPHKPTWAVSPPADRLAMTKLAIGGQKGLVLSPIETRRRGISYTIDTVRAMRRRFPGREMFFIVGADTARDLPTWKSHRKLLGLVRFAVIARPGCRLRAIPGFLDSFILLPTRGISLASNRLRRVLAGGHIPPGSISKKVADYIRARGLYKRKV